MGLLAVGLLIPKAIYYGCLLCTLRKKCIVTVQWTKWFPKTIDQGGGMTQQFCTYTAHAVFPSHNGLIIHTQQRSISTYASQAVCMHMTVLVLENVLCICRMSSTYI